MVFLKIYIKVFQQGSDLVEAVEDKILVGDRPKPTNDIESKIPLEERLAKRKQEEIDEVRRPKLDPFSVAKLSLFSSRQWSLPSTTMPQHCRSGLVRTTIIRAHHHQPFWRKRKSKRSSGLVTR